MAIDEAGLKSWASKGKAGEEPDGDEEEAAPEGDNDGDEGGVSQGDEDLNTLVELVKVHLPDIEASAAGLDPGELMGEDELPEETSNALLDALEGMDEELADELSGIAYKVASEIAEHLKDELQDITPPILAAWLFRAGQLV
jgi:hypothetical protein